MKAIPCGFDNLTIMLFYGFPGDFIVAFKDSFHYLRILLPQPGAALKVCKKKSIYWCS
jgi:hypothetical protein